MRNDLTDITLIVDRSGSMSRCALEASSGIQAFVEEQKKGIGEVRLSLLQFDTELEWVYKNILLKDFKGYELRPRGCTALLHAVHEAITVTGQGFSIMPEADRPGLVIMAIITDGYENASNKDLYPLSLIKDMIEHQTNVYNWQFTYLGANQDAFAEAGAMGINYGSIANYKEEKTHAMLSGLSNNITRMRDYSIKGETVRSAYTDDERGEMEK